LRYFGVFLFAILAFVPYREALALDTKQLFKTSKGSVVLIISFDENLKPLGYGSGFFVGNGIKIVTNYHVIKEGTYFWIKLHGGKVGTIKSIIRYDKEHDLALLESSYRGKPLPLAKEKSEVGEDIIAIGNPQGLEGTLSKGLVSGIREDSNSFYYQITAPISRGSSGGPIINEHGKVIGISTFFIKEGQNLNFAVPSLYIFGLLDGSPQNSPPEQVVRAPKLIPKEIPSENVKTPIEPTQKPDKRSNNKEVAPGDSETDMLAKYVGEVYAKVYGQWKDPLGGRGWHGPGLFFHFPQGQHCDAENSEKLRRPQAG